MPPNTVYVGRPTKWGNPYRIGDDITTIKDILDLYQRWLEKKLGEDPHFLDPLKGKDLACFCPLDQPCHADILLRRLKTNEEMLNEIRELRTAIDDPVDVSLSNIGFYSKRIEELESELERRALEKRA